MTDKYDYAVLLGRFQIPHHGHFKLMKEGLEKAEKLIIGIGSSNVGRSLRNPFSYEQRISFIEHCDVPEITMAIRQEKIIFVPIEDSLYSDLWWIEQVQRKVKNIAGDKSVALIGCNKDETSYYINMFPAWPLIEIKPERMYAATDCRNMYYEYGPHDTGLRNKLFEYTTMGVITALKYIPTEVHTQLQKRFFEVKAYREEWGEGPFNAADPVVIKSGHVLLIKRKGEDINKDKWAFPGGFVDKKDHNNYEAALRELQEETTLNLWGYEDMVGLPVYEYEMFDNKDRDDRAHIISHAFRFKLLDEGPLPEVKAMDDAEEVKWVPLVDLRADNMYADHYHILRRMIAGL